jgi:hypothetical protein
MAEWYSLGCLECRTFVDLHKFLPTDAWYDLLGESRYDGDVFPGQPTYCVVKVSGSRFMQELATIPLASEPDYVRKLVPELLKFVEVHCAHQLFIISDLGDRPWDFPREGWWQWKEKPVAFCFYTHLPRNLVEDLGIRDWPSAVKALKDHPSGYHPPLEATSGDALDFKLGFERVLAMQDAVQSAAADCGA